MYPAAGTDSTDSTDSTMALTADPNFQKLEQWYQKHCASMNMRAMFHSDKQRFNNFRYGRGVSSTSAINFSEMSDYTGVRQ